MDLNQLYQLRTNLLLSKNKVVTKITVLELLESHIRALQVQNDEIHQHEAATPTKVNQSLEMVVPRMEQINHPKTREEVRKAYGH